MGLVAILFCGRKSAACLLQPPPRRRKIPPSFRRRGGGWSRQAALFRPQKRIATSPMGACTKGQAKGNWGQVRQCYLQFDYANSRNSSIRKSLCYIEKLELSQHTRP